MHILEYPDNQLEFHWPGTMIDLFEVHPRAMVHRTQRGTGFTLIYGDVRGTYSCLTGETGRRKGRVGARWGAFVTHSRCREKRLKQRFHIFVNTDRRCAGRPK